MTEFHPEKIGTYRVKRFLGPGAYGQTYLVLGADDELLALKWLRQDAPREGRFRFENEAWALKRLSHPSVPRFVAEGDHEGRPYIVMSYAEGVTLGKLRELHQQEGTFLSPMKTLLVAERILDCLVYLTTIPLSHRDIKDDNVIMSPAANQVTLIDFGLCKGPSVPKRDETFWNAGASRFSPPSKLKNPSEENLSHDVFSVGVLAYLLLTNRYPWEVEPSKDVGHLEERMRLEKPKPIRTLNHFVPHRVSEYFMQLIDTEDFVRPTLEVALKEVKELRAALEQKVAPSVLRQDHIQFEKVFLDPVHGDIPVTKQEVQLINSKEFQRLRRIKQLGTSNLVYHGAEHTRFAHALGTMHVAEKILRRIEMRDGITIDHEERLSARAYALLHDVSHSPYGHTLEDELQIFGRHDTNRARLRRFLLSADSELGTVLQASSYGRAVLEALTREETKSEHGWVSELTSGPSGADVLDYIDRDSYYCGLNHKIDPFIFRRLKIEQTKRTDRSKHVAAQIYNDKGIRVDAEYALQSVLQERYALFMKVYTHPVKLSAGAMLGSALAAAAHSDKDMYNEARIEKMGDEELLVALLSGPPPAKELIARVRGRHLHRPVYSARLLRPSDGEGEYDSVKRALDHLGIFDPQWRRDKEAEFAKRADVEPHEVIIYAPSKAPGAQKVRHYVETESRRFDRQKEDHPAHRAIYRAHLALWTAYLFVSPRVSQTKVALLAELAGELFERRNQIRENRQQLNLDLSVPRAVATPAPS